MLTQMAWKWIWSSFQIQGAPTWHEHPSSKHNPENRNSRICVSITTCMLLCSKHQLLHTSYSSNSWSSIVTMLGSTLGGGRSKSCASSHVSLSSRTSSLCRSSLLLLGPIFRALFFSGFDIDCCRESPLLSHLCSPISSSAKGKFSDRTISRGSLLSLFVSKLPE